MNEASLFSGAGGAITLSIIAFSIVFVVLAGLTLVIYAMRYFGAFISGTGEEKEPSKGPSPMRQTTKKVDSVSTAIQIPSTKSEEIVAAISAAVLSVAGSGVQIKNITPVEETGYSLWKASGRLETMRGFMRSTWKKRNGWSSRSWN